MKKYFKIIFVSAVFLALAGCTPPSESSGIGTSEEVLTMEPGDEGSLPAPMYPLSVGRAVSSDTN